MAYVNAIVGKAEEFVWNNFKFYLLSYATCLLDIILEVQNPNTENPFERYKDFPNSLEDHMGLGSYVTGQAAQFSKTPYITVNIQALPMGGCATRVVMGFDIVYSTDTPPANDGMTRYIGSSAESVAKFRADIMAALDEMFFYAYDEDDPRPEQDVAFTQSFMDRLAGQEVVNPANPNEKKMWEYNLTTFADEEASMSEVTQLKREDRYTGLNVFHVVYTFDINRMWGPDFDCGC